MGESKEVFMGWFEWTKYQEKIASKILEMCTYPIFGWTLKIIM